MRNKKGFFIASRNMREAINQGREYKNIRKAELESVIGWRGYGVEWHHNGNYIAFFVNKESDIEKIKEIESEIEIEKKQSFFYKSKKDAMRAVAELPDCDRGELAIRIKSSKHGEFVCTNPIYYNDHYDRFVMAKSIEQKEAIERLFR